MTRIKGTLALPKGAALTLFALFIGLATTSAARAAIAQPMPAVPPLPLAPPAPPVPPTPPPMEDDEIADLAASLGLKPDQQRALTAIQDDARKAERTLRANIDVAGIDLRRELGGTSPDEKKVATLIDRISALEGEARKARILAMLRVRKLLTAEQWQRLEAARGRVAMGPAMRRMGQDLRGDQARIQREIERARAEAERELARAQKEMDKARREMERVQREVEDIRRKALDEASPPPASKAGQLMINSTPWATIFIDGKKAGVTPLRLTVTPGRHVVAAVWPDRSEKRAVVNIAAGGSARLVLSHDGDGDVDGDDDDDDDDEE